MEEEIREIVRAAYILGKTGANEDALVEVAQMAIDIVRQSLLEGFNFKENDDDVV